MFCVDEAQQIVSANFSNISQFNFDAILMRIFAEELEFANSQAGWFGPAKFGPCTG